MNGRDRLICDLDERWDGPPPKCTGKTKMYRYYILIKICIYTDHNCNLYYFCLVQRCDSPPIVQNAEYHMSNNDSIVGTLVEYNCVSSRFRLVGPKELECLPSGQYDNKPPYCKG